MSPGSNTSCYQSLEIVITTLGHQLVFVPYLYKPIPNVMSMLGEALWKCSLFNINTLQAYGNSLTEATNNPL